MYVLFFLILCINLKPTFQLNAQLNMLSYHPPIFNLTFNQNINFPKFQLLLNNKNLSYDLISTQKKSNYFILEVTNPQSEIQSSLQRYVLRFNQPLSIGQTNLSLDQYIIRAKLAPVQQKDFKWLAIAIASFCYFFSLFDIIGLWLLDYVQIYILLVSNSVLATDFQNQIAQYFLIQFPTDQNYQQSSDNQKSIILKMIIPIGIILFSFVIGLIFRLIRWNIKQYFVSLIQRFFKFQLAISMGFLFTVALIINLIGFSKFSESFSEVYKIFGSILSYIGCFVLFGFLFIELIVVNPRFNQNKQRFKQYQNSQHYTSFSKFHSRLKIQKWVSRNFHFFLSIKKVIISIICAFISDFYYVVLAFQVIHLFYIFTIKPYHFQFYNNFGTLVQSLIVILYFYVFQSDLYFKMSKEIYTHYDIQINNFVRTIIFSVIFLILIVGNFYEIYERTIGLKNQYNTWKQKNQQLIQNQRKNHRVKKFSIQTQEIGVRNVSGSGNLSTNSSIIKKKSSILSQNNEKKQQKQSLLQKNQSL